MKPEKLLEGLKVAQKLLSNLWTALPYFQIITKRVKVHFEVLAFCNTLTHLFVTDLLHDPLLTDFLEIDSSQ